MEITRHWRLKAQRYRLEGSMCPSCGEPMFPPRPVCTKCHCIIHSARNVADFELLMMPPLNRLENAISSERMIR
jgi:rubredoxin-like zinc ribbon protein